MRVGLVSTQGDPIPAYEGVGPIRGRLLVMDTGDVRLELDSREEPEEAPADLDDLLDPDLVP